MAVNGAKVELVKKISIPKYFEQIIIPQMEGYYSDYYPNFEVRPVAKCPLHGEDTPSLRWYEETNTFFCFGCRKGGDIIKLHQFFTSAMNGSEPNFEESVNFLDGYFIQGLENSFVIEAEKEEVIQKSTVAEALAFTKYIKNLEWQLNRDESIGLESKKVVYEAIDATMQLTALNHVNAMDAMRYVKDVVKNVCSIKRG